MARIQIENIHKTFGKVKALDGVSLDVKDKEFFVLFGPAGAGKTTILNCIAGIEMPEEGIVKYDGKVMNQIDPADRNVAMVFENYALYPHMTVYDNIASPMRSKRYHEDETVIKQKVEHVAKIMKMEKLLERLPAQLSNGQKQRVAMGRALVRNPNVFLMDEPLSNLDAKLRVNMRTEIRRIQQEASITAIYVTHDQTEAMSMADDIVLLRNGKIIQQSSPWELYHNPNCIYSAQFIGNPQSNIVEHVMPNNLVLGFRPEKVQLKEVEDSISVSAQVQTKEMLGSEVIYSMKTKYGIVQCKSNLDLPEDQIRKIYVSYSDLMLFDAEGNRTSFGKEEKQMVQKAFAGTEE